MITDNDQWIFENCIVLRDGRGRYAFALLHTGPRLTRYANEYMVAVKRIRQVAQDQEKRPRLIRLHPAPSVVKIKPYSFDPFIESEQKKPKKPMVKSFYPDTTHVLPKPQKLKWRMLPGKEMGTLC